MSEGTQLKTSDFTEDMHKQAASEGWRLSERSDGFLGIERDDEAEKFKSDDDAHEFVADKARLHGSYMHQLALHLDGKCYREDSPTVVPTDSPRMMLDVSRAEFNTILAALRFWQRTGNMPHLPEYEIADDAEPGETEPTSLDNDEIDELCERINTQPLPPML